MSDSTRERPVDQPIPVEVTPPLPTRQAPPRPPPVPLSVAWRGFLDVTGGSVLYCLSALSIIYGITQIMGPLLLKTGVLSETLPCIGALNLYEVALLGTLVFIVAWRKVTDDAISLVVLIPLFLVGSGIALDTVANNGPVVAIGLGAFCAALGAGKLGVLRQTIRVPLGRLSFAILVLVVMWNFLFGPALVKLFADFPHLMAAKRSFWLGSLLLLVTAGLLVMIDMIRNQAPSLGKGVPFLRAAPMVNVFVLVLLGAAGAHLYALGYQFDVKFGDGDFMLLATVGIILLMDAMMRVDRDLQGQAAVLGSLPLIGTAVVLMGKGFVAPSQWGLELLGHPSTVLALGGLGMIGMALRTRWTAFWGIAGVYALGVVLTTGFSPTSPGDLNWRTCTGFLVAGFFVLGLVLKRPGFCVASVMITIVGLGLSSGFSRAMESVGLSVAGGMAGVGGLAVIAIALAFKDKALIPVLVIGAAALAGSAFDFVSSAVGWRDAVAFSVLALVGGLVWWRLRSLVAVLILGLPVLQRLWLLFRSLSAWRYVVLSFILLGLGAWLSLVKSRKTETEGIRGRP